MSVPQSEITTLTGLARKLVEHGLLSPEAAEAAFEQSKSSFVKTPILF